MPFLLLLLLTLACLPDAWSPPPSWVGRPDQGGQLAAYTWAGLLALVSLAAMIGRATSRNLLRFPERREALVRRYGNWRFYFRLTLFGYFAFALYVLGWGWTVQRLGGLLGWREGGASVMPPGGELILLAPLAAGLMLSWLAFYGADRVIHDTSAMSEAIGPFWTRRAYLGFHIRQNLLVFVLAGLLTVQKSLHRILPETHEYERAFRIGAVVLTGIVFVSLPWLLRIAMRLKPLPTGPLRDRLQAASQRLNFRCSNILVWNTHSGAANALVAGILPWLRYVILTDRLANELTPDEVEAVFGHEVGHVKHHHMLYYLGFMLISLSAVAAMWDVLADRMPSLTAAMSFGGGQDVLIENPAEPADLAQEQIQNPLHSRNWGLISFLGVLGAYIFVVFGFLSRRCERQADIFGCRTMSCADEHCSGHEAGAPLVPDGRGLCSTGIHIFISALEKVAKLNGISRNRPGLVQSWQHSTIARRVEFLQGVVADPRVERRFQRTVTTVKWAVLLALVLVLMLLGGLHPQGWTVFLPW